MIVQGSCTPAAQAWHAAFKWWVNGMTCGCRENPTSLASHHHPAWRADLVIEEGVAGPAGPQHIP